MVDVEALGRATADLDPPLAALDLAALDANAADLVRRAGGTPVRVAAKSVRCRWVLDRVLALDGVQGVMAFSLAEAIWLVRGGVRDVLVGYPSVDRAALRELAADPALVEAVTLMVDGPEQLGLLRAEVPGAPLRVCLDVDASLRIGRLHLGVRRSPLRTPTDAAVLATLARAQGLRVVGVMFYEAQIAGLPDSSPAVRFVKRRSAAELARRRGEVVRAVEATVGPLAIVNSGGTGSLEVSSADATVTEVTAGSGLYRLDAVRRLPGLRCPPGAAVRAAGRPSPGARHRHPVRRWLHRLGGGFEVPAAHARHPRADAARHRGGGRGADPGARPRGRAPAGR